MLYYRQPFVLTACLENFRCPLVTIVAIVIAITKTHFLQSIAHGQLKSVLHYIPNIHVGH